MINCVTLNNSKTGTAVVSTNPSHQYENIIRKLSAVICMLLVTVRDGHLMFKVRRFSYNMGGDMGNTILLKDKYGFTLLELVMIITIIGILGSFAIPGYLGWRSKHELNRAVYEYTCLLQRAKMTAIKDRAKCKVSFYTGGYELTCENSAFSKKVDLGEFGNHVLLKRPDGSSGIPKVAITFNSRGLSNSAYLYFSDRNHQKFCRVGPLVSGSIKSDFWNGKSWDSI